MRLLLVHNLPPWDPRAGGGQRVGHEIAIGAANAGHDVRALYLGTGTGAPDVPYDMVWVPERRRLTLNALAMARAAARLFRAWVPEVVHGSAADAGLLSHILPRGTALVGTSHHPDPPPLPPIRSLARLRRYQNPLLEAHLLRRAHHVVATSRWGAEALATRGYLPPSRPVAVVNNGVSADWFRPPAQRGAAAGSGGSLFFAGRLEPAKGLDLLLEAMATGDALGHLTLRVAGAGPHEADLRARADALGVGDRVAWLGHLSPPELRVRLAQARAFVLPSRNENYPLSLLEAMAAGIPVVSTLVGGIPEMIEDGRSGLLVPPGDATALRAALERLMTDEALRRRLAEGGATAARAHRWDVVVARLLEEYRLAHELARGVPRSRRGALAGVYREAAARAARARAPIATGPRPAHPARIAVVRPGRLGDLLLADPLLAALEERYPEAELQLVTDEADRVPPWMLERVTLRTVALRDGPEGWRRPGHHALSASLARLSDEWRGAPPDLLLIAVEIDDPEASWMAAEISRAAPGSWKAALVPGGRARNEIHAAVDPGGPAVHEVERLLKLAAAAGASQRFRLPRVPAGDPILPPWSGPTVAIHPGASRPTKRWPLERWGSVAAQLREGGIRVVAVGGVEDQPLLASLEIPFDDHGLLDRVGTLSLSELAAVLGRVDAFAGNDSFPFHLAVAAGVPALVLAGPGAARWWSYPAGTSATAVREPVICSPRRGEECPVYTTCPHGACMQSIRVETVARAVRAAVSERKP